MDLKPSNILVTAGGTVKLLDFGIVSAMIVLLDFGRLLAHRRPVSPRAYGPRICSSGSKLALFQERKVKPRRARDSMRWIMPALSRMFDWRDALWYLQEFDLPMVREFCSTWTQGNNTALKKLERLRAFFRYAVESKWVAETLPRRSRIRKSNSAHHAVHARRNRFGPGRVRQVS